MNWTLPGGAFWQSADGRIMLRRHCDGLFTLECDGELVMPPGPFDPLCDYVWAEFPPL